MKWASGFVRAARPCAVASIPSSLLTVDQSNSRQDMISPTISSGPSAGAGNAVNDIPVIESKTGRHGFAAFRFQA
jgi:hypothetical protein